ncbi:hypothetical protein LPJ56_005711 [Coemansia sp. RSA 2599]|nr:hypothetical protein LPJ75_005698 [Coemansia sp. RSA 2598]KAJ1811793.1 hypothetical protein LPJ56_005711 [Coemansia sp. RSA 2599]
MSDDTTVDEQSQHLFMRSLNALERQLSQNTFAGPLGPTQVRQLTNIERLLSDLKDTGGYATLKLDDAADRIAALENVARPWIQKKNDALALLSLDGTRSKENGLDRASDDIQEKPYEAIGKKEEVAPEKPAEADAQRSLPSQAASESPSSMPSAHVRRSSMAEKRAGKAVPDSVEGVERLLKSQRATQDDLSSDLAKMAGILKKNSLAFSDLVEKDRVLVQETTDLLDKNTANLEKHGGRLTKYRKRAWGTTGMTWLAVLVVVSVFFMLVLFMRVAPKRF